MGEGPTYSISVLSGAEHPIIVLSGRQRAAFYLC